MDYLNKTSHFVVQYLVNIFSFCQLFLREKLKFVFSINTFSSYHYIQFSFIEIFDNPVFFQLANQIRMIILTKHYIMS